jgi:predicted O-methyltransferase YrrM
MGYSIMKWEEDLVTDIRTGDPELDNQDIPFSLDNYGWNDINELAGVELARQKFMAVRDRTRSILEIGVNQFGFTRTWLDNKLPDTTYVGIDIGDRSYLNDPSKLTWTIQNSSENYSENVAKFNEFGITQFDFIYIDGWHSINTVLADWEYTNFLAPNGIVGFHDTNYHPGPKLFTMALDRNKWEVEDVSPKTDWGVVFVRKL